MAISEAALLRARGAEFQLNGQSYWVRYPFDTMEKIEVEYGGLDDFINGLLNWKQRFRTIRRALELGLTPAASAEQVAAILNEVTGADLLDVMRAIASALSQAMGVEISLEPSDPKVEGDGESPGPSPGDASTTSPQSVLDDQTPSSGK